MLPRAFVAVQLGERVLAVLGRPVLDRLEVPAESAVERLDHDAGLHRCPVCRWRLVDADGEGTEGDPRDRLLVALVHEQVGDHFALGAEFVELGLRRLVHGLEELGVGQIGDLLGQVVLPDVVVGSRANDELLVVRTHSFSSDRCEHATILL
jgi:hypothetical protein